MYLEPGQRRALVAVAVLAVALAATSWDDGWRTMLIQVSSVIVGGGLVLAITQYANRDQRRAKRLASGEK